MSMKTSIRSALLGTLLSIPVVACANESAVAAGVCAPVAIPGHYGPYDYMTQRDKLSIVEAHHFGTRVEALVSGRDGTLGGDISYTINASPNHHRALMALMKLGLRTKSSQPPNVVFPIDCYFDRAIRFKPTDTVVRSIFAIWLAKTGRQAEAERQLQGAVMFAGDNVFSLMNIGLTYLEVGKGEPALEIAHKIIAMGYQPTLLIQKLREANQWTDPEPPR